MTSHQVRDIWDTIQLKAVWRPMAFVYVFGVFQGEKRSTEHGASLPGSWHSYFSFPSRII